MTSQRPFEYLLSGAIPIFDIDYTIPEGIEHPLVVSSCEELELILEDVNYAEALQQSQKSLDFYRKAMHQTSEYLEKFF